MVFLKEFFEKVDFEKKSADIISIRGSRNFGQGGPGQSDKRRKEALTFLFFFSPQLIVFKSNG